MIRKKIKISFVFYLFAYSNLMGYDLPSVDLGLSNILGGGPLRALPGFYWYQYFQYYQSNKFLDGHGKLFGGTPSPNFKTFVIIPALVYHSLYPIFGGHLGFSAAIPLVLHSKAAHNILEINSNGTGFGDLTFGPYIQWLPFMYKERQLFIHRFEFDVTLPIGKNKSKKFFNPGDGFFYISPYWAGTLYLHEHLALSWRLYYIWSAQSHKTNIKAGDAIDLNFSMECELITTRLWLAICGYFVKQLKDSAKDGVKIPHSREQVLGIGPGFLYFVNKKFDILGYLYWETLARNRTQGFNAVLRFIWRF